MKTPSEISAGFNEMVALRDIPGGLEIELFKSITPVQLNDAKFTSKQWTYIPTKGYGGRNFGTEILPLPKRELSENGKWIKLAIPGIRDNSPPYVTEKN